MKPYKENLWFDKQGRPLNDYNEIERLLTDRSYTIVARTRLPEDVTVSTVWLGLNQNWNDELPPIIFETLVLGGEHDGDQYRYRTIEEAKAGHKAIVEELK